MGPKLYRKVTWTRPRLYLPKFYSLCWVQFIWYSGHGLRR